MKISDLVPGQNNANLELTIISVQEPKKFNKNGRDLLLLSVKVSDGESEINLNLWNMENPKLKPGAIIKITNGYVSEFKGEKQLSLGREGKLEFKE